MLTFVSVRRRDASALSIKARLWGLSSASDSVYASIGSAPDFVCWATVGTAAHTYTLSFYLFNLKCQMRHILRAPRLVYRRANAKAFVIGEIDSVRCYISDWRTWNEHSFTSFTPIKVQIKYQKLKFLFRSQIALTSLDCDFWKTWLSRFDYFANIWRVQSIDSYGGRAASEGSRQFSW